MTITLFFIELIKTGALVSIAYSLYNFQVKPQIEYVLKKSKPKVKKEEVKWSEPTQEKKFRAKSYE